MDHEQKLNPYIWKRREHPPEPEGGGDDSFTDKRALALQDEELSLIKQKCAALENELGEVRGGRAAVENELRDVRGRYDISDKTAKELSDLYVKEQEKNKTYNEQLKTVEGEKELLQRQLVSSVNNNTEKNEKRDVEIGELKEQLARAQNSAKTFLDASKKNDEIVTGLQEESEKTAEATRKRLRELGDTIKKLEAEKNEIARVSNLNLEAVTKKVGLVDKLLKEKEKVVERLRGENADSVATLQQKLADANQKINKLEEAVARNIKRNEVLEGDKQQLVEENTNLVKTERELSKKNTELEQEVGDTKRGFTRDVEVLHKNVANRDREIRELDEKIKTLETTITIGKEQLATAKAEWINTHIENSNMAANLGRAKNLAVEYDKMVELLDISQRNLLAVTSELDSYKEGYANVSKIASERTVLQMAENFIFGFARMHAYAGNENLRMPVKEQLTRMLAAPGGKEAYNIATQNFKKMDGDDQADFARLLLKLI